MPRSVSAVLSAARGGRARLVLGTFGVLVLPALLAAGGCAGLQRAGVVDTLRGTVSLDRQAKPPAVLLVVPGRGSWRLEGPLAQDLRELDRALVEVSGTGEPADPSQGRAPARFEVRAYRLVEVGGRPALVGTLAWEGSDLLLVELDRADRVPLAGPALSRLPALMGKAIWVAGERRQGRFVVERYGVLRDDR